MQGDSNLVYDIEDPEEKHCNLARNKSYASLNYGVARSESVLFRFMIHVHMITDRIETRTNIRPLFLKISCLI